jgi:hypothetical protein
MIEESTMEKKDGDRQDTVENVELETLNDALFTEISTGDQELLLGGTKSLTGSFTTTPLGGDSDVSGDIDAS